MKYYLIFFAYLRPGDASNSFGDCLIESESFPEKSVLMKEIYQKLNNKRGATFRGITGAMELNENEVENWKL